MKTFFSLFCVFYLGFGICSCSYESYTDVLEVSFESLSFKDIHVPNIGTEKVAVLVFSFIDGNGNIGAREKDREGNIISISMIHYDWEKLSNGDYEQLVIETENPDGSIVKRTFEDSNPIPYEAVMDKSSANNKTLKGTIEIPIFTPLIPSTADIDSLRIGFYIVDRNGKKSIPKGAERKDDEIQYSYTRTFHIEEFDN